MIERIVIIDNADPTSFYGVNNSNMHLIRNLFPKLRITARGSVIKVIGDDAETAEFEKKIKELESFCSKYNKLTEEAILDVIKGEKPRDMSGDDELSAPAEEAARGRERDRGGGEKVAERAVDRTEGSASSGKAWTALEPRL